MNAQGTAVPKAMTLGPGWVQGSMEGSHTSPTIKATWQVPVAEAAGQVKLDKDTMHLSAKYSPLEPYSHLLPLGQPSIKRNLESLQAISNALTATHLAFAGIL